MQPGVAGWADARNSPDADRFALGLLGDTVPSHRSSQVVWAVA